MAEAGRQAGRVTRKERGRMDDERERGRDGDGGGGRERGRDEMA